MAAPGPPGVGVARRADCKRKRALVVATKALAVHSIGNSYDEPGRPRYWDAAFSAACFRVAIDFCINSVACFRSAARALLSDSRSAF